MIFDLSNPFQLEDYKQYVNKLYSEGAIVEVKKINPKRTLKQNAYLHTILAYFASQYGCSEQEAKSDYFKRMVNPKLFVKKRTNKYGIEIETLRSTSDLDKEEMRVAIERFRNWAAQFMYIPSADEHNALVYARQQIENNKEFI